MKHMYRTIAILPMLAVGSMAQNNVKTLQTELRQVVAQGKMVGIAGAVMGPAVKGQPYSGVEVSENSQTLADGTRIHRQNETKVYRDSEGRVRRETPDQITIWDPVANASYFLDPKAQTATKMPMPMTFATGKSGAAGNMTYIQSGTIPLPPGGPDKAFFNLPLPPPGAEAGGRVMIINRKEESLAANNESLGQQMIQGVSAEGTRVSSTIEAGAIGNDRPIQIVSESWFSPDLQTMVESMHNDPRMGQEKFQLTNILRVEPSPDLFQVPASYQLMERK